MEIKNINKNVHHGIYKFEIEQEKYSCVYGILILKDIHKMYVTTILC